MLSVRHRNLLREMRLPLVSMIVFAVVAGFTGAVLGSPEDGGDCASCHQSEQVLPAGHPPTAGMDLDGCLACHVDGTPLTLHSAMPLSHQHMLAGITCADCHGEEDVVAPAPMTTEQCLVCHGPLEALGALTADVQPTNPHMTPHGPTFAECDLCHQVHEPSQNFCADCHDFEFVVP
ncbi:MAG: cytochrome c3 family protein [Roseitalea sp.]|nr:cytochrome c3 family protein [Roseitalea sp.]MBO6722212.1 cytochrome c3 family protein [Roseitalea sp.]MBO6744997.1 cytochrome c3 family protein [Roseitalea sp.]